MKARVCVGQSPYRPLVQVGPTGAGGLGGGGERFMSGFRGGGGAWIGCTAAGKASDAAVVLTAGMRMAEPSGPRDQDGQSSTNGRGMPQQWVFGPSVGPSKRARRPRRFATKLTNVIRLMV